MSRAARVKSRTGIYHVMARGNNKDRIFFDVEDYSTYVNMIKHVLKKNDPSIYAYCLMTNHIHMIIKENQSELSEIVKNINSSFAQFMNNKYKRVGHLFQGRYRSEPIEKESYFFAAIRYVHNNPVAAGITDNVSKYPWSSYHAYVNNDNRIVDIDTLLDYFSKDRETAINQFKDFSNKTDNTILIDEELEREYLERIISNIKEEIEREEKVSSENAQVILVKRLINNYNISQQVVSEILKVSPYKIRKIINI